MTWKHKITEGTKYFSATGVGLYEYDGVVRFGNVFSIPAGYVGNIYVPFNVTAGGYGKPQYKPFDYETKPATVTGKVYIDSLLDKDVIEAAIQSAEYVTALPATMKADLTNANLFDKGDSDFFGGLLADAPTEKAANQAGSGTTWGITYKFPEGASFNQAGLAVRMKNLSGADYGIRSYFIAGGKTYVPQGANVYMLIAADGTVTTNTDTNRNMIIPADFDGTIVIPFADFATDSAGTMQNNVNRESLTVTSMDFYIGSNVGYGVMYGEAAWIGYDGELSNKFTFTPETVVNKNGSYQFVYKTVGTDVTVNSADVTLSTTKIAFGKSVVTATPVEGKSIISLKAPENCVVTANNDGSYTVEIDNGYAANVDAYTLEATVDSTLEVAATITGKGTVSYNGVEVTGTFTVGASSSYTLVVTPAVGYVATVKAGGVEIEAGENGYVIPMGTTAVSVEFTVLAAKLTVTIGENGTVVVDGMTLENTVYDLEQGQAYVGVVTPAKGYIETVTLNGVALEKGENGYEVLLTEDAALVVSFEKIAYTITYDLDRGENAESNPATYTIDDEITFAAATKEGYVFLGWFKMDGETEVEVTGIAKGSVGNVEVFAKFEVEEVPSDDEEPSASAGCFGSISAISTGVVTLAVAAIALKKKEN